MLTIEQQKASLRAKLRRQIASLAAGALARSDADILARLTQEFAPSRQAQPLYCFAARGNEIATRPILELALAAGKRVALPRVTGLGQMEARLIANMDELVPGSFGILEPPPSSPLLPAKQIDLTLVPCLACDRSRNRRGQGGGYYDRFLAGRGFVAVGLCREALLLDFVPIEPWDQALDAVLTDKALY
jgi:5-formyltetrahydrofolate cyclo-ligase